MEENEIQELENTEEVEQEELESQEAEAAEEEAVEEEEADKNQEIFRKFMDVQQLMGALHHRRTQKDGPLGDSTRGRGRILSLLKLKDGVATKDMAQILGIRVSSLNETLAKLVEDGLIERTPNESDKRVMLVSLTDAGREAKIPSENLADCLFDEFTDEDLDAFGAYLDRISANLENELGADAQKLIEEQRAARKAFFEKQQEQGRGGRDDRGGRDRDDRGGRGGRDRDDRGRGGRDDRGYHGGGRGGFRDDRGGRGGFRDRDDRGGRGGFGGRGGRDRDDRGGRGGRDRDRDRW